MKFPLTILSKISGFLLREKKRVQKRLLSLKAQDPFSDPDRLIDNAASDTEAKEESSHDRVEALEKVLKRQMEEIEEALERIKKGTYGKCVSCGEMINNKRLVVKVTALYCVECERKREDR